MLRKIKECGIKNEWTPQNSVDISHLKRTMLLCDYTYARETKAEPRGPWTEECKRKRRRNRDRVTR